MMMSLQSYVRQSGYTLKKWAVDPTVHRVGRILAHILVGFGCSAASLGQHPMPLTMGLVLALRGWSAGLVALGGSLGYWVFWGSAGKQPVLWLLCAVGIALILGERPVSLVLRRVLPAAACLIISVFGVVFQLGYADATPVHIYILRVLLGGSTTWLFMKVMADKNPVLRWIVWAMGVLALAQIAPVSWLSLGYPAAAALCVAAPFPAGVLAGLALDLAQITPVPMTAVMGLGFLYKLIPKQNRWIRGFSPLILYLCVAVLCKRWDPDPLLGLAVGGILGSWLPNQGKTAQYRGETGVAQVRLELAAGVLTQTQRALLEFQPPPVDLESLYQRAVERACGNCPGRKGCKDAKRMNTLPGMLLEKPLAGPEELPIVCRKSGRFLYELRRAQEQLRAIRGDRDRQREYKAALVQQYGFLSEYLQEVSDGLARKTQILCLYEPRVEVYGNRPEADNGDRCLRFAGVSGRYYVVLCDGMGTGLGAAHEAKQATVLLQKLLSAGYPAHAALRSLNSLCALTERSGAVTVDLAELELDTGRVTVYKWGAAPSYLVTGFGAEQVGISGPPPGLSVTDHQEKSWRLSMRRGELLILVSDGVVDENTLSVCRQSVGLPTAELGTRLLAPSRRSGADDATAVMIRLVRAKE